MLLIVFQNYSPKSTEGLVPFDNPGRKRLANLVESPRYFESSRQ